METFSESALRKARSIDERDLDRLAEFAVTAPIEYEDYLKGSEYLKKMKV